MSLKIKSIFASSLLVLAGFVAAGQTTDEYEKVKRIADSLDIRRNYELGVLMFRNYLDFVYPLENITGLTGFGSEISIAEAPDEICKDLETNPNLVFSPNSDVVQYDDQNTSYGYVPDVDYGIVEQRLNMLSEKTQMAFRINETVKTYIDYYALKRRNYTLKLMAKQQLFFPLFEKHLRAFGMPEQLKYLSIVESALNPKALSRAGALGLWQFMPGTGKMFGLNGNYFVDERMDPEKATIAACKYLKFLYESFDNNWELALASYNCGPGAVARAIRRSGGHKDFWSIYNYLPRETRNYVPIFTAVTYIMTYAEEHNLIQHQPEYAIDAEVVYMNQSVNLRDFAKKINVCYDDLMEINPELRKGFIHYTMRNYALKIPADRIDYFLENREEILGTTSKATDNTFAARKIGYTENTDKIYHKIKHGESLGMIASRYGVTTAQLRTWNNIRGNMIHAGKNLVINKKTKKAVTQPQNEAVAKAKIEANYAKSNAKVEDNETQTKSLESKAEETKKKASTTHHKIQRGESLNMIARKYGITVADLKAWNGLTSEKIHPNTNLAVSESAKVSATEPKVIQAKVEFFNKITPTKTVIEKKSEIKGKSGKKQHTIKQGDTLWGIANEYSIPVTKLKKLNKISSDKHKLKIGQVLVVGE
jgi:membrane-bound lytic murein transglycosylase D